jgi:acyl carrier protein
MAVGWRVLVVMLVAVGGCTNSPSPSKITEKQAPMQDVERVVRSVIAERFSVNPASIDMNAPLSDPPCKANELDVVELIMTLEEHLGVDIPDKTVEKHCPDPLRCTPAMLASIGSDALGHSKARKK